jgi:hypothetical protein
VLVPKTSVYEQDGLMPRQDNVRLAWKIFAVETKTETQAMQRSSDGNLRRRVLATDFGHQGAARFPRENVHALKSIPGEWRFGRSQQRFGR